jgi:hypothetical protein
VTVLNHCGKGLSLINAHANVVTIMLALRGCG